MSLPSHFHASILFVGATMLVSCGGIKSGGRSDAPAPPPPVDPAYVEVNDIVTDKCSACHADEAGAQPHFIGHQDALKANAAAIADALTTTDAKKKMPKQRQTTPLTDAETTTILVFLGKQPAASGRTAPTFAADVAPIVAAKCAPCHSDQSKLTPHFIGHEDAMLANGDAIATAITATSPYRVMPPPAFTKTISDGERTTILKYLGQIAP